ncbi:M15 family metallopeptidase [Devosia sp. SD17-2]|uniref:M15 family metallopeptidase n=1 Tax=Devosia sp. SD17-2 TaxID=2976459 RepID=UPI0023D80EF9|nr:M15 family metallopeptidase [Devosia sp. SD17-2]WEJ32677.1 M15 family metallopeptidase [Devosia sp. SD17-2]
MTTRPILTTLALLMGTATAMAEQLPENFVYLADIAPQIRQDMRYAGEHNFVGRPITGYEAGECILTRPAAEALRDAAIELAEQNLVLRVYDCYRPARAVADFAQWARDIEALDMQAEFYPRVDKSRLFELGYIAERSGHSRGSTVDLTIEPLDASPAPWQPGDALVDCALPDRYADNVLDFGTGYDCFDTHAHHGADGINPEAEENREMLADLLERHGYAPYAEEWWHYTLRNEPFPDTYFDFVVAARPD